MIYARGLVAAAILSKVLTMWLANEALRRVKGSDVALIAASEPLWAAVAAMAVLGDAPRLPCFSIFPSDTE